MNTMTFNHTLWIFIGIGFIGAISLTLAAIFNLIKVIKGHSFKHIVIKVQFVFTIANVAFVVYALGISIENEASLTFWNSAPTWMGNIIPFVLNTILTVGKIVENKRTHSRKEIQEIIR